MMKVALECERMPKLENIDLEIKYIQKRMRRFLETGDKKRLMRLRTRLAQLQFNLDLLRKKDDLAEAAEDLARLENVIPVRFRRSYRNEFWAEDLLKGSNNERTTSA